MGHIKISTAWKILVFEQEDNTVMNLKEVGWKIEKWNRVAQNRDILTSLYTRLPSH
jgi:hypothetical protein